MIVFDELWIGDWLKIKSSEVLGQFNGFDRDGNVLIKTKEHRLVSATATDVEKIDDEEESVPEAGVAPIPEDANESITVEDFGDSIDLHYDELIKSYLHLGGSKLEYQLDVCSRFIQSALHSRLLNIQIIHGRGQGVLKAEVERLLKHYPEITIISSNPNLASVDGWMNYH